mgnify:CR=1 FL=1
MEEKKLIDPFIPNEPEKFTDPTTGVTESGLIRPIEYDAKAKSPEEKIYIILYKLNHDDYDEAYTQIFNICIGRTEAYSDIKSKLESGMDIDVHVSKIITETKQTETASGDKKYYLLPYDDCISIYSFCKSVENYYSDDEFDIEEYNNTSVPEVDEILSKSKMYLTAEQESYKRMLEVANKRKLEYRDYYDAVMRENMNNSNEDNN